MRWNRHSRDILEGSHAFLSPSKHSWLNYDQDKLIDVYKNLKAKEAGTRKHALAKELILLGVQLPKKKETLNMYVNDAIRFHMTPEQPLKYSEFAYGTADAISVNEKDGILRIHDLKTGKTPTSFLQLMIYASYFFLEYDEFRPGDFEIILRIYQNCEVLEERPATDEIVPIMDKIIFFDEVLHRFREEENDVFR